MSTTVEAADLIAFLRSLRSVRRYAPTPVPDDVIHEILEVGRWTGSAKNTQPWELLVVRNRETLRQLSTMGQFAGHLAGAAFAILLIMETPTNSFDAGRLAQNLMLGGWAFGVGSCIGSLGPEAQETRAKELLGVPRDRSLRTTIAFGYPAGSEALKVSATPEIQNVLPSVGRRPFGEIVHVEKYGER
ncbi:MAG TPA: nitroreductase family protein [Chloroflexota bacterium]|nr:nitroreductase family protein [Chloroflexota bacterium]